MTGPHFDMGPPTEDPNGRKHWDPRPCICGLTTYVDAATGLCVRCWRGWRWSPDGLEAAAELAEREARLRTGGPLP